MPVSLPARVAAAIRPDRPDSRLLADFLRDADQAAFAELVRRHGPVVLGVCRRFLGATPDADDAFQATFLVLVRKARGTAWRESLGPWLYGVAVKVARKARFVRSRRAATERQGSAMTPEPATPARGVDDLAAVLDEELAALPETYRRPLVLCELQGLSRKAAARELGLAEGTLSSRLARGRRMLRARLARRGVTPAIGTMVTTTVSGELAAATARHAAAVLVNAAGAVPAGILALTDGVVKAMLVKWKLAAVAVALGVGVTGFGAWNGSSGTGVATAGEPPAVQASPTEKPNPPDLRVNVPPLGPNPASLFNFYIGLWDTPPNPATRSVEITFPGPSDPVATIFGDKKLTRQDFAEYLIRRYGKKELESFVNKEIIARAFGGKGWTISAADVLATLDADAKAVGLTREQFFKDVLPKYGKTATEWIEDVITPRLMLNQLCKERVTTPTDQELRQAFDHKYGEKVEVRVAKWAKDDGDTARAEYEKMRASEVEFAKHAGPAGRELTTPHPRTPAPFNPYNPRCAAAAKLQPGEVSPLIAYEIGYIAYKCDKVIPADKTRSFDTEKPMLLKEVVDAKINSEVVKLFDELKREAKPQYHLTFPDPVVQPNPVSPKK